MPRVCLTDRQKAEKAKMASVNPQEIEDAYLRCFWADFIKSVRSVVSSEQKASEKKLADIVFDGKENTWYNWRHSKMPCGNFSNVAIALYRAGYVLTITPKNEKGE